MRASVDAVKPVRRLWHKIQTRSDLVIPVKMVRNGWTLKLRLIVETIGFLGTMVMVRKEKRVESFL